MGMAKRETRAGGARAKRPAAGIELAEGMCRSIVDSVLDGIVISDGEGRIVFANHQIERLFGYTSDELLGKRVEILLPRRLRKMHAKQRADFYRRPRTRLLGSDIRFLGLRSDGSEFPAEIGLSPIRTEGEEEMLVAAAIRDVTATRKAQEGLRQSEEWFSTTLASIGDAVIATDRQGRVKFMNPTAERMTGWSQTEAAGQPLLLVFPIENEETGESIETPVERVIRESAVVGLANHAVLVARDGARRCIDDSAAPIRDEEGEIIGVVMVFHDVTDERLAGRDLKRLTARLLEMQEEERRQVAYDIHDGLGQLLTAASLHVEAFAGRRRPAQSADVEEELGKARRCLTDAVVEMRRMVSDLGPLLLDELGLVGAGERLLDEMAERAGWETEFEDRTDSFRLDRMAETAVMRILQEALANAAKHADAGRVDVHFAREDNTLTMEVRDWGRGFDSEGATEPMLGRHVGLVGMRERAVIIGGQFEIESAPGEGTVVRVAVPAASDKAPVIGDKDEGTRQEKSGEVANMVESRKAKGTGGGGITVLIADDHPMVREGLRSMLSAGGVDVVGEAASGSEAIERVEQLGPEVILMDVRMPDMDGLAATEIIKDRFPGSSVIVITSYESKDYLRRAIEAGAAGYLLKGMSRDRLIDAIRLVKGGGALIDSRLLAEMLKEMGVEETRFQGVEGVLEALTPREEEVLQLLVRGLTNKEIAAEMQYSMGTVKNVVQRVIEKLGVSDRTQAAVYAVRAGISPSQQA